MNQYKGWVERSRIGTQGTKSLTVALKARGCSYAKRKKECRFCAFHDFSEKDPMELGPARMSAKLHGTIAQHDIGLEGIGFLKIYNGGSFLANSEIKPTERCALLAEIARNGLAKLLIESRPEHIDRSKLAEAAMILGGMELEVAVGFETADDSLRKRRGKGFTRVDFERGAETLSRQGATLGAYILIKPIPMSDEEAIRDVGNTLEYLSNLSQKLGLPISARLEPFTPYEGMDIKPGHTSPSLQTVLDIIRHAPEGIDLFLGWSESEVAVASDVISIDQGSISIKRTIDDFNSSGDRRVLETLIKR